MNEVSGIDQPPEGTVSSNNACRRTFLKGAGLAGAAGLASAAGLTGPFMATTSARASTGIILGANAPGCWSPPSGTPAWKSAVDVKSGTGQHALGCRSYRDTPFTTIGESEDSGALGSPPAFPGEKTSIPVVSIKPDPTVLLNPNDLNYSGLVQVINDLIYDGMVKASSGYFAGTPQLTAWHEAGNLYTDSSTWGKYGVVRGTSTTINGVSLSSAQIVRSMHVMLQGLCDAQAAAYPTLPRVDGCIIYGDIDKMASGTDSTENYVPTASYPLDWYGIDVYYEGDGAGSNCTSGDLSTASAVSQYMDGFLTMAQDRAGGSALRINITECNADAADDSARPQFFENLANWLYSNGGYRMLTFFPDPAGNHSVIWPYVADAAAPYTIMALNSIQATYGR